MPLDSRKNISFSHLIKYSIFPHSSFTSSLIHHTNAFHIFRLQFFFHCLRFIFLVVFVLSVCQCVYLCSIVFPLFSLEKNSFLNLNSLLFFSQFFFFSLFDSCRSHQIYSSYSPSCCFIQQFAFTLFYSCKFCVSPTQKKNKHSCLVSDNERCITTYIFDRFDVYPHHQQRQIIRCHLPIVIYRLPVNWPWLRLIWKEPKNVPNSVKSMCNNVLPHWQSF